MKTKYLVGLIALVMLVLATAPVMAAPTATVDATGSIAGSSLSISSDVSTVPFGTFNEGPNEIDNVGNLIVTSSFVPAWTVTAGTVPNTGYMYIFPSPTALGVHLTNPLEQYNYKAAVPGWETIQTLSFTGSSSTTMSESFRQTVVAGDKPGNYKATIVYTIVAN